LKETKSREKDDKERSQWGNPAKKFPSSGGWSNGGGADWKGNRNHTPRPPRSEDNLAPMFTATRQRLDSFTSEEQELLSDVEPVMRTLRKIMHPSAYPDGDPISDDDKTFVLEKILNFHPQKETKLGSGVDFITVDKHTIFSDSRCFFVVSTDGAKQDFSYRKSLNNYLMKKYPDRAEEFIDKYFTKPRPSGNRDRNNQDATPPGEEQSQPPNQSIGNGGDDFQTQTQSQSPSQTRAQSPSQAQSPSSQSPSQTQT
jgi:DNA-directed RNA polymerase-5 subunit 1